MANINSLMGSSNSYSSIYGSRNVISGLASGLDTESLIEQSVSGYKSKIAQLQQQIESITWKQDAFRGITDKLIALSEKYTSYTSKTNLASKLFFNQAVKTITNGTFASKVSATGRSSSDIKITSVTSLATAAKYTASADKMKLSDDAMSMTGKEVKWDENQSVSAIAGSSLTVTVGDTALRMSFGADDKYETLDDMVEGINKKLEELSATVGGKSIKGSDLVKASVSGDTITFEAQGDYKGNGVYISGVSGKLKSELGVTASSSTAKDRFENNGFSINPNDLIEEQTALEYLSKKSVSVEYNGVTKTISLADFVKEVEDGKRGENTDDLASYLQERVNSEFGAGKVTVGVSEDGGLSFGVKEGSGSTLKVTSSAGEVLGIGSGVSNYLNTTKTLGDLLGKEYFAQLGEDEEYDEEKADDYEYGTKAFVINGVTIGEFDKDTTLQSVLDAINNNTEAGVKASFSGLTNSFVFTTTETGADKEINFGGGLASDLFGTSGNAATKTMGELLGDSVEWGEDGTATLQFYVNGNPRGGIQITKDSTLEDIASKQSMVKAALTYDEETGKYTLNNDRVSFGRSDGTTFSLGDLVEAANTDNNFTAGSDAVMTAMVNGQEVKIQRSSNTVEMDGLSVTLKGTFDRTDNEEDWVSFETRSDSDNVVGTIRSFVDEYNAILKEIHDAYSTQPLKNTSGDKYSPLTDDDRSGMSDSAIAAYEEKAKTGLLFGDSDLSALYGKLVDVFSSGALSGIGLSTSYSNGLTQISLDEDKLREALDSDPDKVRDAFTESKSLGGTSDGLMTKVKTVLDTYASKSVATPGILVKKAGTKLSSVSLQSNTMQKQIDSIQEQISKWQTKLSNKVDYYTRQFTALESLMSTMNNQSSMLASLMGG